MKTAHLPRILFLTGLFLLFFSPANVYGQPYELDWALKIESPWDISKDKTSDHRARIAVDGEGCSVITGGLRSDVCDFGGTTLSRITTFYNESDENNGMDLFVARYHPDGTLNWVRQAGGEKAHCEGKDVAVDGSGNVLITGNYFCYPDPVTFYIGNNAVHQLNSNIDGTDTDMFIAKYSSNGDLQWVKRAGGILMEKVAVISCDPDGSFFITGCFEGDAVFGEGETNSSTLTSETGHSVFVARYNPDGSLVWAKKVSESGTVYDIASDGNGNCLIAGEFQNSITFNPGGDEITLSGNDQQNMFIARMDNAGAVVWAKTATGDYFHTGTSIDTDSEGNATVTGAFVGSVNFEGNSLPGEQNTLNTFVAKYAPSGNLLWAKEAGGSSATGYSNYGLGLVTDDSDNILVTGAFVGKVTFGEGSRAVELTTSGYDPENPEAIYTDVFTLKFDPSGSMLWARKEGGLGNDEGDAVAVGPDGRIFVTGYFDADATFGAGLINPVTLTTGNKVNNLFVMKILESDLPLEITSVTGPVLPFPVNTEAVLGVSFTGEQVTGATIDWGDGSSSYMDNPASPFTASHVYTCAGVYAVTVTVVNANSQSDQETWNYCVVYDPSSGFVTGGGWIISPAGAYKPDPALTGKANFGFVSKYKKGQSIPEGNTEFQFKTAGLNFRSSVYEWLVIAGSKAMFKGSGTINGAGIYGFLLSAIDGNLAVNATPDKFRIKIWDMNNDDLVVYDNNVNADLNADPETGLGGGSVVIHSASKKSAAISDPSVQLMMKVYPNPFTDRLWFELTTPETGRASIDIYDVSGRKVATLLNRTLESGESCRVDYVPVAPVDNCLLYRVILGGEVYKGKVVFRK